MSKKSEHVNAFELLVYTNKENQMCMRLSGDVQKPSIALLDYEWAMLKEFLATVEERRADQTSHKS